LIDLLKFGKIRWFLVITYDISNFNNPTNMLEIEH